MGSSCQKKVEQQSYKACMGLLRLAETYSLTQLEAACHTALSYTGAPSYKSISNLLAAAKDAASTPETTQTPGSNHGITRVSAYYRRNCS